VDKKRAEDKPQEILEIADRKLVDERLGRVDPAVRRFVTEVFEALDPDARFAELARAYLGNQGKEGENGRSAGITYLAWAFGAPRPALKKLLRWKGIVGEKD
jgi:hypothetical protein